MNKDAAVEQQALKAQVHIYSIFFSVHQVELVFIQVRRAEHEKELTTQSLRLLQQEHKSLFTQQCHWEDLHHVTEQIEALMTFRSQADKDELRELKYACNQH